MLKKDAQVKAVSIQDIIINRFDTLCSISYDLKKQVESIVDFYIGSELDDKEEKPHERTNYKGFLGNIEERLIILQEIQEQTLELIDKMPRN